MYGNQAAGQVSVSVPAGRALGAREGSGRLDVQANRLEVMLLALEEQNAKLSTTVGRLLGPAPEPAPKTEPRAASANSVVDRFESLADSYEAAVGRYEHLLSRLQEL